MLICNNILPPNYSPTKVGPIPGELELSPVVEFIVNTGTAFVLGTIIGFERQLRQHPAGLRTNSLVCLGAALFVSVTHFMSNEPDHPHIAAQIVSGIGFLAGGVILREGFSVHGMNTAATIWCTAAIGTLAGVGHRIEAALGAAFVLILHVMLRPVVDRIENYVKIRGRSEMHYRLQLTCAAEHVVEVRKQIVDQINAEPLMSIQGLTLHESDPKGRWVVIATISSRMRKDESIERLLSRIEGDPSRYSISWEEMH